MTNRRRPKPKDFLLTGGGAADPNAHAMAMALTPLDAVAREMESKWGIGRLPELVSEETAVRFGVARECLDQAIEAGDVPAVSQAAANLRKGWGVLDAEATAAGHKPFAPEAWAFQIGPTKAAVIQHGSSAKALDALDPGCAVYTLEEIGNMLHAFMGKEAPSLAAAKAVFPGAVARVVDKPPESDFNEIIGDEIPF